MSRRHRKKLPIEPVTTQIESLSHDGRGIAHIEGKTTFVRDALPGEVVAFQYTSKRGSFDEGQTVEVLKPSNQRTVPPCPHYGVCGGCSLQHMALDAQIAHKQQVLLDQLQHFGKLQPVEVLKPLTGPSLGYRYKARLGVRFVTKKDKVLVGFRERNGRYITDMRECPILHAQIGTRITTLTSLIGSLEGMRHIPQIEIAAGDDRIALIFRHVQPLALQDVQKLHTFGENENFDIYLQPGNLDTVHKLYPSNTPARLSYTVDNVTLHFHPSDFTQVNPTINRKMVNLALRLLEPSPADVMLDLFCGLGNFTLPIAQRCKEIIGIEGDTKMVTRAQENAAYNHITNAKFYSADLAENITHYPWSKLPYTKLLIDPPRSGALELIRQWDMQKIQRIVYVSCNPATLARDAGELAHNFTLQKTGIMDMFPHTSHVESIALFTR